MANVHIRIYNRVYDIACDDGQEDNLKMLADEVDSRVRRLLGDIGDNPGEIMYLLLASLMLADEVTENKKETAKIAAEVQRLSALVSEDKQQEHEGRMVEIENAMAVTIEEIAMRIERIAEQIEVR